ncbi:protein eyes shut homolog [Limulus polyphemus]|uniref:Protein eyes shut homolog n=1 Tax=Limulus polyphemus TaxID=6850 RepID=A0ABM1SZR2_LIMPO|nr:protein eyes shut homolog [Limulus polyphemus]
MTRNITNYFLLATATIVIGIFGTKFVILQTISSNTNFTSPCSQRPCLHGVCQETGLNNEFRCFCVNGFTGLNCQTNYNECQSSPCLYGATCVDYVASFKCVCSEGFTGQFCEVNINECLSNPCLNNGICIDDINDFICDCPPGFIASKAQQKYHPPVSLENMLQHGAETIIMGWTTGFPEASYLYSRKWAPEDARTKKERAPCVCPLHFTGWRCEEEVTVHIPHFGGNSFLQHEFRSRRFQQGLNIDVSFRTTTSDGLILYSQAIDSSGAFVQLVLSDGMLKFSFSCGKQTMVFVQSHQKVNSAYIVNINIILSWIPDGRGSGECTASLQVNGTAPMKGSQYVVSPVFNFTTFYLGGFPPGLNISNVPMFSIPGFVGCMRDLQINGKERRIVNDAENGAGITECENNICSLKPCQNGGQCKSDGEGWFCDCKENFTGITCERRSCPTNPCQYGGTCLLTGHDNDFVCLCPFGRHGKICDMITSYSWKYFHGDVMGYSSYYKVPGPSNIKEFLEVRFRFTTSYFQQVGLLMFLGQDDSDQDPMEDFIAVGLIDGYVVYQFNLGSGTRELRSLQPINASKSSHTVNYGRYKRYGWIVLDSQQKVGGFAPGHLTALDVASDLYIGGHISQDLILLPVGARQFRGFQGCIFDIEYRNKPGVMFKHLNHVTSGRNIQRCNYSECDVAPCHNGGTCVDLGSTFKCECSSDWTGPLCSNRTTPCSGENKCALGAVCVLLESGYRCDCPLGRNGIYCDKLLSISDPSFNGENSYMSFEPVNIRKQMRLRVDFKSKSTDGLLFYAAQRLSETPGDFISVSLHNRQIELRYNLGTGTGTSLFLKSPKKIELNQWYSLEVGRHERKGYIKVNGSEITGVSPRGMVALDFSSEFFLGGVPDLSTVAKEAVENEPIPFYGCVRHLSVNGKEYDLTENGSVAGRNIEDCDGTPCGFSTCRNGGTCSMHSEGNFECYCTEQFTGRHCDVPIECFNHSCENGGTCRPLTSPSFSGANYSCDCSLGWKGMLCEIALEVDVASFSGESYLHIFDQGYDNLNLFHTHLSFIFSTTNDTGLIFWNGKVIKEGDDYLGLGLQNGYLKMVWNLGWFSRNELLITNMSLSDGRRHHVEIYRIKQTLTLEVDRMKFFSHVRGDFMELNTHGQYYFGGFPREKDIVEETGGRFTHFFTGCIGQIILPHTLKSVNLMETGKGSNILNCEYPLK